MYAELFSLSDRGGWQAVGVNQREIDCDQVVAASVAKCNGDFGRATNAVCGHDHIRELLEAIGVGVCKVLDEVIVEIRWRVVVVDCCRAKRRCSDQSKFGDDIGGFKVIVGKNIQAVGGRATDDQVAI